MSKTSISDFLSENELDTFGFHDSEIRGTLSFGDTSVWVLSHIDVYETNQFNTNDTPMVSDSAIITFYNCRYSDVDRNYGNTIHDECRIEREENTRLDYINRCIEGGVFECCFDNNNRSARFSIRLDDHLLTFHVEFSKLTVQWNSFVYHGL